MNDKIAISVENISKSYRVWKSPSGRILFPLLENLSKALPKFLASQLKSYSRTFFSDVHALSDVSFKIKKGESFGIIGRNGSGKSTILQIIAGTLAPTKGKIAVNGKIAALLELGAGFNFEFTGRENVYLNASIMGLSKTDIDNKFRSIEEFADIGEFIDRPVKTYSSGMVVRLAFSVIAHVDADILIVDEALAVGDVFFVQKCMRYLRHFQKKGVLLFVSHDTHSVNNLCDNAVWLVDGKVQMRGYPKDVTEAYFGHFYLGQDPKVTGRKVVTQNNASKDLPPDHRIAKHVHDQRLKFINHSIHRNDIEVFEFDPFGDSFGEQNAIVSKAKILDEKGRQLSWIVGGEIVKIFITIEALTDVTNIIVGFGFKDNMGQVLFGDNTYLSTLGNQPSMNKGESKDAIFELQMPILKSGDYTMSATVATGYQDEHLMQHWLHDAIAFKSTTTSNSTGLIGIPMINISIETDKSIF